MAVPTAKGMHHKIDRRTGKRLEVGGWRLELGVRWREGPLASEGWYKNSVLSERVFR
jgi:hypothetical protein